MACHRLGRPSRIRPWLLVTALAAACSSEEAAPDLGAAGAGGAATDGGSGDGGGSAGSAPIDFGAAKAWVDAQCAMARHCCDVAGFDVLGLTGCEEDTAERVPFVVALLAESATVDPAVLATCVASLEGVAETCTVPESAATSCDFLWAGTRPVGEPCENVAQCARGDDPVVCLRDLGPTGDVTGGTCLELIRGSLGEPCVSSNYEGYYGSTYAAAVVQQELIYCDARDGLYCSFGRGECIEYAALGAPCLDVECAAGLYCDDVCKPRGHAGEPCDHAEGCAMPLTCDGGTCTEPPVATPGLCEPR